MFLRRVALLPEGNKATLRTTQEGLNSYFLRRVALLLTGNKASLRTTPIVLQIYLFTVFVPFATPVARAFLTATSCCAKVSE